MIESKKLGDVITKSRADLGDDLYYEMWDKYDQFAKEARTEEELIQKFLNYAKQYTDKKQFTSALSDLQTEAFQKGITGGKKNATIEGDKVQKPNVPIDLIAKSLGSASTDELLDWNGGRHWTSMTAKDMQDALAKSGIDFRAALQSINDAQTARDRVMALEGDLKKDKIEWIKSAALGILFPRVKEAALAGRDWTNKDLALDVAENAISAIPAGRAVTGAARLGAKAGMKYGPKAVKTLRGAVTAADAMAAPIAIEGLDAAAYDDYENPNRANFSARDAAIGSVINAATPMATAGIYSGLSRRLGGNRGKREVAEVLSNDPAVDLYLDRLDRMNKAPMSNADANLQPEIDAYIVKEYEDQLKKMSKKQKGKKTSELDDIQNTHFNNWKDEMALTGYPTESGLQPKAEAFKTKLEALEEYPIEHIKNMYDKQLDANSMYVDPALVFKDPEKYGVTKKGKLAFVHEGDDLGFNEVHGLPDLYTSPDRSAEALMDAAHEIPEGRTPEDFDFMYPGRKSEFGIALEKAQNDPQVRQIVAGMRAGLPKQMLQTYTTNKLGRSKYVPYKEQIELLVPAGYDEDVVKYLNDAEIRRQWEAGFKPNAESNNPLYKAWEIWKANQKEK